MIIIPFARWNRSGAIETPESENVSSPANRTEIDSAHREFRTHSISHSGYTKAYKTFLDES